MVRFDFLVIGGGIAGLTYALEVAEAGSVAILFKKGMGESSTSWAQGGVAAVTTADDTFELHQKDTEVAGAGLCHPDIVEIVVTEGPERVRELIARGANFDKDSAAGGFHLHREGGHSRRRIFHTADATGAEIQRSLLAAARKHPNIKFFTFANAIDLITTRKLGVSPSEPNRAVGAYVLLNDREVEVFLADKILMATGGAGKVYLYTSNPDVASGDGIAMSYRAGARVANMEFFQFHPTCLYHPRAKSFLITEAMRGEGAKLRRTTGEEFMASYHPDRELAPRDVVARAIDNEMKKYGEDYVLLDISHRDPVFVREHFPTIYHRCLEFGFDITAGPVPVVPAAHYLCGGIVVDNVGCTDIEGLYAAGECAHTGLHGANRLASNSLLEGLVFGYRAARDSVAKLRAYPPIETAPAWNPGSATSSDEQVVIKQNWDEIRRFMWNYVGIVRTNKRLERALRRCELIGQEIQEYYWNFLVTSNLLELRNLNLVAELVVRCALARRESRGLHFNLDYPNAQEEARHDTILER
ncbi:MAG: L-aspartate oxidase [Pseudomonadota bacterium]|jgi:L-aspartate oxidase